MSLEKLEFKFNNTSEQVESRKIRGEDYKWFNWEVFMEEPEEKLKLVESVEYRLHETFPNPIRTIYDSSTKFALKSSGWGVFRIFITVYLKDGREVEASHYLKLYG